MRSTNKHKTRKPSVNPRRFFALIAMSPKVAVANSSPNIAAAGSPKLSPKVPGTNGDTRLETLALVPGTGRQSRRQSRRLLSLLPVAKSPKLSPKVPGTNGDARPETPALVPGTDARSPKPSPTVAAACRHVAKAVAKSARHQWGR
jgi:hypothetical protein